MNNQKEELRWVKISQKISSALKEGNIIPMVLEKRELFITKHENHIFCGSDICPHAKAKLHLGKVLENGAVECPLHRYQFDLNSGTPNTIECGGLEVYPAKQENNDIYIGFEPVKSWWQFLFS